MKIHLHHNICRLFIGGAAKRQRELSDAFDKPICIIDSRENENINRMKMLKVKSELYESSHEKYVIMNENLQNGDLPPFLQTMKKALLVRIAKQMSVLP